MKFIYLYGGIGLKGCLDVDASEPMSLYMYPKTYTHARTHAHTCIKRVQFHKQSGYL